MPIDPTIPLQAQLPKIDSPLSTLAQVSQAQNAMSQNRLAELAFGEKQREIEQTSLMNEAYRDALEDNGQINRQKLFSRLAERGLGSKLPTVQKLFADQEKSAADLEKARIETTAKKLHIAGQAFGYVRNNPTVEAASAALDYLEQNGIYTPEQVTQYKTLAQSNPGKIKSIADQAFQAALDAKDQLPKFETRNTGGTTDTIAINPVTGMGEVVNSVKNSQSPDSKASVAATIRGQNLTDARAREANEAARGKIVTTADGGVVLVDDRAGTARPVTDPEGKQVIGKVAGQLTPKQISDARGKLQTVQILRKQLDNLKNVRGNLGAMSQGIVAGRNPLSEAGSNYDKALAALQTTIRQLTRTPGEGAMSDYESRMAQAQLPMRADFPSSIDQGITQIEDLANVIETGYNNMLETAPKGSKPVNSAGPSIDDLLKKYGD